MSAEIERRWDEAVEQASLRLAVQATGKRERQTQLSLFSEDEAASS